MVTEASLAFADGYAAEDDVLRQARARAAQLGIDAIAPASGATLGFMAGASKARAVVELGTGAGVSGLWMLRGLAPDAVLTSVDLEAEHQRSARDTFTAAGFASQRFRLIAGAALDVMPRLTKAGYDVVFIDADKAEYGEYLDPAMALLRPGGLLCVDNVLWNDNVADPSARDPETLAIRDLLDRVRADERLNPVLWPVGNGLLAAHLNGA